MDENAVGPHRIAKELGARLETLVPGYAALRSYDPSSLRMDLAAGIVLTAMLVPQGMAYAALAGLPPVTGLYATCVPLLAYAVFGPSRILVLGPDSALAPLVAAAVVPVAVDESERVEVAGMLALMVGGILLAGSLARLGFLTDLLSRPVRTGYLAGIAVVIIIEQTPNLLGYSIAEDDLLNDVVHVIEGLSDVDTTTAAIGLGCLAVILGGRRISPFLPGILLAVVGATLAVGAFDLEVSVLGEVPGGLPSPRIPSASVEIGSLALSALAISLIAFADTSVLSRTYAAKTRTPVDPNQEMIGLGAANLAGGFFQGFPI
ncbi:MAG TPA: SulP family inorganic anion transporter, partial [Dehalococcoidia bacterium]|nr:SulP family inorganic anion transporter [Dehalococcoidia bacterium]